jgi:hypothetical protein
LRCDRNSRRRLAEIGALRTSPGNGGMMGEQTLSREAQELEQLLTRATNTLGEDVVRDVVARALGLDVTPVDPASSPYEAWVAERIARAVQTIPVHLPAAIDTLKADLRRMLMEDLDRKAATWTDRSNPGRENEEMDPR